MRGNAVKDSVAKLAESFGMIRSASKVSATFATVWKKSLTALDEGGSLLGAFIDRLFDSASHGSSIPQHFVARYTHDLIPLLGQVPIARPIMPAAFLGLMMLTIGLNDQLQIQAAKINGVWWNRAFTTKLLVSAATVPKHLSYVVRKLVRVGSLIPSQLDRVLVTMQSSVHDAPVVGRCKFTTFPEKLKQMGYITGFEGKGWGPGKTETPGRKLTGKRYENFWQFLQQRSDQAPFCYWLGTSDPHRPYEAGSGKAAGIDLSAIDVPKFLPDCDVVRNDIADYYVEVQRFDALAGNALKSLEAAGELDNTIIPHAGYGSWALFTFKTMSPNAGPMERRITKSRR